MKWEPVENWDLSKEAPEDHAIANPEHNVRMYANPWPMKDKSEGSIVYDCQCGYQHIRRPAGEG